MKSKSQIKPHEEKIRITSPNRGNDSTQASFSRIYLHTLSLTETNKSSRDSLFD